MPGRCSARVKRGSCKKEVKAGQGDKHERKRGRGRAVLDPDLEIRGGGGGAVSQNIFPALWALVWSTNKGATRPPPPWAPPLDRPL